MAAYKNTFIPTRLFIFMNPSKLTLIQKIENDINRIFDEQTSTLHTRTTLHQNLQNEICNLGNKYEMNGVKEFQVRHPLYEDTNGYIDVVWYAEGFPKVAIEIDSSFRKKSLVKLIRTNIPIKIWLYYGKKSCKEVLSDIEDLIVIERDNPKLVRQKRIKYQPND
ncbi:hypothetical protein [Methanohalophilus sp.]